MAAAGVDMFKVSRWMGHRSLAITDEVYAKLFQVGSRPGVRRARHVPGYATRSVPCLFASLGDVTERARGVSDSYGSSSGGCSARYVRLAG